MQLDSPPPTLLPPAPPTPTTPRTRAILDNPALAERSVQLLQTFQGFARLTPDDAQCVVGYMREVLFAKGEVMLRAGDQGNASFMLLLLEGEVSVRVELPDVGDDGPLSVLGPGSVLGEMSMLDGAPRSATCTAITPVMAAGLARRGLERLLQDHPAVAARLLAGMAQQMADRLRAVGDQLQLYAQLNGELRDELINLRIRLGV